MKFNRPATADLNDCGFILYSLSLVLCLKPLKIFQTICERKREVTPTINTVVSTVTVHRLHTEAKTVQVKYIFMSAATANSKMVYLSLGFRFTTTTSSILLPDWVAEMVGGCTA